MLYRARYVRLPTACNCKTGEQVFIERGEERVRGVRWSTEPTGESAAVKFSRLPAGGSTPGVKLIALRTEHDIPPFHRVNTEARRFTAECRVPDRTGTLHNRAGCSIHVDPKPDLARRDHRMVALGELPLELSE